MSLAKLNSLRVGDVISLQDMGRSELCVNGLPIYEVQIGSRGDNAAVKIVGSTMAGATNDENVEEPTQPVEAEPATPGAGSLDQDLIRSIPVTLTVELGSAKLKLKDLLRLAKAAYWSWIRQRAKCWT